MAAIRHRPAAALAINECGRLPLLRHSLRRAGRGILPFGQLAPSGAIRPRVRSGRIVTTLLLTAGTLKAITGWVRPLRVSAPSCSVSMLPLSAALTRWLSRIFRWTRLEVAARLGRLG